mgnify:CR=1 FL=1
MTNVPSGSYSVMITDGNGCIDSTQIYLSQPNPLSATAIVTDASCYGERNGRNVVSNPLAIIEIAEGNPDKLCPEFIII